MSQQLEQRFVGALIGTFVGDALGMPVEGWSWTRIAREWGEVREMLPARLGRGTYTDDTLLMIALAESLLANQGRVVPEDLVRRFRAVYDPRRGFGAGMHRLVRLWEAGVPWDEAARSLFNGGSYGNGAAMRVAPVGVLYHQDPTEVYRAAVLQARVTHAHPLGQQGAALQALAVAQALRASAHTFSPEQFLEDLEATLPASAETFRRALMMAGELLDRWEDRGLVVRKLGNRSAAHRSVPTAIFAFLTHWTSFEEALVYAVSLGGDTDTLAAMTGAIAGAFHGVHAVPPRWWDALEQGEKGRDYVVTLGERLYHLWRTHGIARKQGNDSTSPSLGAH